MARYDFGGTLADFVVTSRHLGGLDVLGLSAATLTFWSAQSGGTRYTDLVLNGSAASSIVVGADGQVPKFQGPDGVTEMWADGGSPRIRVVTLQGAPGPIGATGPAGPTGAASTIPGPTGPQGAQGTPGLPGVNAVPADNAVAGYVAGPGATATALAAIFAAQLDATGLSTATINTWLAAPSPAGIKRMVGAVTITAPLVLQPGIYHDFTQATITAGAAGNMLQNRAAATTQRTVSDAATTAGSTTITSASAAFTSGDVGRSVVITNSTQPIVGTIASVTNGTTAVLNAAAAATVSAAAMSIYTRDKGVSLVGGTFNRGTQNGTGTGLHGLLFRRVDGLHVSGVTVTSGAAKYAISIGDCTAFNVERVTFAAFSDGVHICGPSTDGSVSKVYGTTGDDSVAITPSDYPTYNDVVGPVSDVVVEKVYTTSNSRLVLVNGGSTGTSTKNITVRDVLGTATNLYAVMVADDNGYPDTTGGVIDNVLVENVAAVVPNATPKIFVGAVALRKLTIRDIPVDEPSRSGDVIRFSFAVMPSAHVNIENLHISALASPATIILVSSSSTIGSLTLRNCRALLTNPSHLLWVDGTLTTATIEGATHTFSTGSCYLVNLGGASGRIDDLRIRDARLVGATGGGGLIAATNVAHTLPKVRVSNSTVDAAWLADLDTDTTFTVSSVSVKASAGLMNIRADSQSILRGAGLDCNTRPGIATGGALSIRVPDAPAASAAAFRPTLTPQANLGAGGTASVDGTDADGVITLVVGTTPGGGYQSDFAFVTAHTIAPLSVQFIPLNSAAQSAGVYVTSITTAGFHITTQNIPAGTLSFAYHVKSRAYGD